MTLPTKCYMPDLSDLQKNSLMPYLFATLVFSKSDRLSEKTRLYLRNFIRLIDKSINEYQEAREAIIAQVKERHRPPEQIQEGRIIYLLSFVNSLENSLNAIRRLFLILDAFKGERLSPAIPRIPRRQVESLGSTIKDIRHTIEHLDERIQKDQLRKGKPIMLSLSDDDKGIIISDYSLRFSDLKHVIRNFYNIGKYLIGCYGKQLHKDK